MTNIDSTKLSVTIERVRKLPVLEIGTIFEIMEDFAPPQAAEIYKTWLLEVIRQCDGCPGALDAVTEIFREVQARIGSPVPQNRKAKPTWVRRICGHSSPVDSRDSLKWRRQTRSQRCPDCEAQYRATCATIEGLRRATIAILKSDGGSLYDAVELAVGNRALRPAVYEAARGYYRHWELERILNLNRADGYEKINSHPMFITAVSDLDARMDRELHLLERGQHE